MTVIPHELERVDREDGDRLVSAHEDQFDGPKLVQPLQDAACYMAKDMAKGTSSTANSDPRNQNMPIEEEVEGGGTSLLAGHVLLNPPSETPQAIRNYNIR